MVVQRGRLADWLATRCLAAALPVDTVAAKKPASCRHLCQYCSHWPSMVYLGRLPTRAQRPSRTLAPVLLLAEKLIAATCLSERENPQKGAIEQYWKYTVSSLFISYESWHCYLEYIIIWIMILVMMMMVIMMKIIMRLNMMMMMMLFLAFTWSSLIPFDITHWRKSQTIIRNCNINMALRYYAPNRIQSVMSDFVSSQ